MLDERGQGTVEWVGLVALIAGALLAGSVLAQAPFAAGAVGRQFARALCIVRAGDCDRPLEPCVVSASTRDTGLSVSLVVVDLGGGRVATVERRSDGTYLVSVGNRFSGGLFLSAGVGLKGEAGGGGAGADVAGRVQLATAISRGRGWIVRSQAEADELLARSASSAAISSGRAGPGGPRTPHRPMPEPDVVYRERGDDLDADLSLVLAKAKATGGVSVDGRSLERTDRRTGERTISFTPDTVSLTGKLSLLGSASRRIRGGEGYRLVLDAAGRPVDLQIHSVSRELPDIARPFGAMLEGAGRRRPDSYETTAHLDLTDPVSLAAASVLLRRPARYSQEDERALTRLHERIEQEGTVEVRGLRTEQGGGPYSLSASTGIGRVGARALRTTGSSRLVTAASRGLDGSWHPRDDCVSRAVAGG